MSLSSDCTPLQSSANRMAERIQLTEHSECVPLQEENGRGNILLPFTKIQNYDD